MAVGVGADGRHHPPQVGPARRRRGVLGRGGCAARRVERPAGELRELSRDSGAAAMSIPADIIECARDTDIVAVVERYGLKLKRAGTELKGPCPLCGGSDRLLINTRHQIWGRRGAGKECIVM